MERERERVLVYSDTIDLCIFIYFRYKLIRAIKWVDQVNNTLASSLSGVFF